MNLLFFHHLDQMSLSDNELTNEKKGFIEAKGLGTWRFHDHIHKQTPDCIYLAVTEQLDWIKFGIQRPILSNYQKQPHKVLLASMKKS